MIVSQKYRNPSVQVKISEKFVLFLQQMAKEKLPIFLINTLLFHIPILALTHRQTDRQMDRETNTLTVRGLEELFFQLCCCVSFLFWWEFGFGFTYLCT